MANKWVILDRDGVINYDSSDYIKSAEEWVPIEGSIEAVALLYRAGYQIAVATNQSGLARGLFELSSLVAMHQKMRRLVKAAGAEIAGIYFCPHGPNDNCNCRKPKTGLLLQIAATLGVNLETADVVGDSLRDLQSAVAVGSQPILVRTGKGEKTASQLSDLPELADTPIFDSLADYAVWRVANTQ